MKALIGVVGLVCCLLFSGCTVAHVYYVRNLSPEAVDITFVFPNGEALMLRDSLYIPYSATSHLVKKNTDTYMTDSLKAKKISLTEMKISLPSGAMIMLDHVTSHKLEYHMPEKMKVMRPSKGTTDDVYLMPKGDAKTFKEKGKLPHLLWYDIY
jgi:hypothetical protein